MLFALFGFWVILMILACLVQGDGIDFLILHNLPHWVLFQFRSSWVQLAVDADCSSGIGGPALRLMYWNKRSPCLHRFPVAPCQFSHLLNLWMSTDSVMTSLILYGLYQFVWVVSVLFLANVASLILMSHCCCDHLGPWHPSFFRLGISFLSDNFTIRCYVVHFV